MNLISQNYLMHYGVKGMKWGVRHEPQRTVRVNVGGNTFRMQNALERNEKTYDKAKGYKALADYHNSFNKPGVNTFKRGHHAAKAVKYNQKADKLLKKLGKVNIEHVESYKRSKANREKYDIAKAALDDYISRTGRDVILIKRGNQYVISARDPKNRRMNW